MATGKGKADWHEITRLILDKLDIRAEYEALGVDVTGRNPSGSGWIQCRAMGREDRNPSAAINVGDGQARGRYKDFSGGMSCGLFDFAENFGNFADWKEARKHYAEKAGVSLPKGRQPKKATCKFPRSKTTTRTLLATGRSISRVLPKTHSVAPVVAWRLSPRTQKNTRSLFSLFTAPI